MERLKAIELRFEQGENATDLMNEMERIFKIPMMNDENFNAKNKEVIELYRRISFSR